MAKKNEQMQHVMGTNIINGDLLISLIDGNYKPVDITSLVPSIISNHDLYIKANTMNLGFSYIAEKVQHEESVGPSALFNNYIKEGYEAFLRIRDMAKEDDKIVELLSRPGECSDCINSLLVHNELQGATQQDVVDKNVSALLTKRYIGLLSEMIKQSSGTEKLGHIAAKALAIQSSPQLLPDFYEIGYPPLFGEDPIADIATRLGGMDYDKCNKLVTESVSRWADKTMKIAEINNALGNFTTCLSLRACFDYLPQEKITEIQAKVKGSTVGVYNKSKTQLLQYKKTNNK